MLLQHSERQTGALRRFARCFRNSHQAERIEHSAAELVSQRVYGPALGCEDLNDHDRLRSDPLPALLSGKADAAGRKRRRDRGRAGASKSALNQLELTPAERARYKKIALDSAAVDALLPCWLISNIQRQTCRCLSACSLPKKRPL